jgi:LysR substrate binding domain
VQRYPAVEVRPRQALTEQLQDQLLAGELDCAIGLAPGRIPSLTYIHVYDEPLSVWLHEEHPLADRSQPRRRVSSGRRSPASAPRLRRSRTPASAVASSTSTSSSSTTRSPTPGTRPTRARPSSATPFRRRAASSSRTAWRTSPCAGRPRSTSSARIADRCSSPGASTTTPSRRPSPRPTSASTGIRPRPPSSSSSPGGRICSWPASAGKRSRSNIADWLDRVLRPAPVAIDQEGA